MNLAGLVGISETEMDFIVSTFVTKRITEKIIPELLKDDQIPMEDLKAEYAASIIDELTHLYNKFGIQVTENIRESWVKFIVDGLI